MSNELTMFVDDVVRSLVRSLVRSSVPQLFRSLRWLWWAGVCYQLCMSRGMSRKGWSRLNQCRTEPLIHSMPARLRSIFNPKHGIHSRCLCVSIRNRLLSCMRRTVLSHFLCIARLLFSPHWSRFTFVAERCRIFGMKASCKWIS